MRTGKRVAPAAIKTVRKNAKPKLTRGLKTRDTILLKAVSIASVEGLEGLTLGKLATELHLSKSGLFAHFGSKEELQLAVVEQARLIFVERVIAPAHNSTGVKRLRAFYQNWLAYADKKTFPGGCFFTAASLEFDDRPGKVRDEIVKLMKQWIGMLEQSAVQAQSVGDIRKEVDARQFAFELHSLAMGANWSSRLFKDKTAFATARKAILQRIDQVSDEQTKRE